MKYQDIMTDEELVKAYADSAAKLVGLLPDSVGFTVFDYSRNWIPFKQFTYIKEEDHGLRVRLERSRFALGPEIIAEFTLRSFPGCCAFAISTASYVAHTFQKKGLGTLLNQFRQEIAKRQGYPAIICTDRKDNAPERKILTKEGWEDIFTIKNTRTNHDVFISVKKL